MLRLIVQTPRVIVNHFHLCIFRQHNMAIKYLSGVCAEFGKQAKCVVHGYYDANICNHSTL